MILVTYTESLAAMADTARRQGLALHSVRNTSPVVHAGGALVLLGGALVLSIFKPRGLTAHGWRRKNEGIRISP